MKGRPSRDFDKVNVYFSRKSIKAMWKIARKKGLTFAEIARRAIEEYVERETAKK